MKCGSVAIIFFGAFVNESNILRRLCHRLLYVACRIVSSESKFDPSAPASVPKDAAS